ncbi:MAG: hypothetical protein ACRDSJ_07980, partial [Rubrobacteraceae bacterium]
MIDDVKRRLVYAGRSLEAAFDVAKFRLKARFGLIEQIEILPYRGHGTDGEIFLKGRVLEEGGVTPSAQTDTIFHNLKNMARRFMSAEVPHAVVRARFGDREVEARADV